MDAVSQTTFSNSFSNEDPCILFQSSLKFVVRCPIIICLHGIKNILKRPDAYMPHRSQLRISHELVFQNFNNICSLTRLGLSLPRIDSYDSEFKGNNATNSSWNLWLIVVIISKSGGLFGNSNSDYVIPLMVFNWMVATENWSVWFCNFIATHRYTPL